jgi:hypothetical protein
MTGKRDFKVGFWLGLAAIGAMVAGVVLHRRAIMACGPIILLLYFGYLLYCFFVKTDKPKEKQGREESFDGE